MLWQILQKHCAEKVFPSSLHYAVTGRASKYNEADVSVFPPAPPTQLLLPTFIGNRANKKQHSTIQMLFIILRNL